jgi:sugar/nucleoside kinase (ribokinase family)
MDGVIVVDQVGESNCGVITDRVRSVISDLAIKYPDLIIAVDSRSRISQFDNVILKPNSREVILAFQSNLPEKITTDIIKPYGYSLFKKMKKPVFITLGDAGILVFTEAGCEHVPAAAVEPPFDIVGAGDSCMSAIVASLCSGADPVRAAFVGTLAASITIQQIGKTGTASASQIKRRFHELEI